MTFRQIGDGTKGYVSGDGSKMVIDPSHKNVRGTILHELQHLIDKQEGRPIAGSVGSSTLSIADDLARGFKGMPGSAETIADLKEAARMGYDNYRRDQGESLARLVDTRKNLGPAGLRVNKPIRDLDVKPKDQLVGKDDQNEHLQRSMMILNFRYRWADKHVQS